MQFTLSNKFILDKVASMVVMELLPLTENDGGIPWTHPLIGLGLHFLQAPPSMRGYVPKNISSTTHHFIDE